MDENAVLIRKLQERIESLKEVNDVLASKWRQNEADYQSCERWLAGLIQAQEPDESEVTLIPDEVAEEYRNLTVKAALTRIAAQSGGLLVVNEAVKQLRQAGFFAGTKNASQSVYGRVSLMRKEGRLEHVRPGVYRLVDPSRVPFSANGHKKSAEEMTRTASDPITAPSQN